MCAVLSEMPGAHPVHGPPARKTAPELTERHSNVREKSRRNSLFRLRWMALGPFRLARNTKIPHLYVAAQLEH